MNRKGFPHFQNVRNDNIPRRSSGKPLVQDVRLASGLPTAWNKVHGGHKYF